MALDEEGAALTVFVTSGVGFTSNVVLDISGTNENREPPTTVSFTLDLDFAAGSPDNPTTFPITIPRGELTAFLNNLPTFVEVIPTVIIGDGVGEGATAQVIADDHFVRVDSVIFQAPARFQITANTRIETNPVFREFADEEARRRITNNFVSTNVITEIENRIPLGVRVSIRVADTKDDVYAENPQGPVLRIPSTGFFGVDAAPVNEKGRATGTKTVSSTVEIVKADFLRFLQPGGVYTGVLIEIDNTGGSVVEIFADDYVVVRAGAEVVIQLNDSLVD